MLSTVNSGANLRRRCFFIGITLNETPLAFHFSALARTLISRGHRVVILTPHRKVELENHQGNPAIYTWPSDRPIHPRDALFLLRLIRHYQPSVFLANFGAVNLMSVVGWLARVPVRVAWYHTLTDQLALDEPQIGLRAQLLEFRKRWVYAVCTHIAVNSRVSGENIQNEYGVPPGKCHLRYYSLKDPSPTAVSIQPASLCCVGRLHHSKGQDVLIRAIQLLSNGWSSLRVELIGNGPEEAAYRGLAVKLGVENRCAFLGRLRHDEVLRRMANAVATVVPSRQEAFGLVNIESLAVGTPVVASGVGGILEIIRDGVDGFLVPPDDPEALASKLKLLLRDPELRRKMGLNARERFLSTFEQDRIVTEQANWFESLANAHNGG